MSNSGYVLKPGDLMVRDGQPDEHELSALVASGDCFVTLATQLDEVTQHDGLPERIHADIESVTSILLYLQRHYKIVAKTPDYHQ